ncbi:MAG: HEAT repeat domain-containing protein [Planctomycetales bacterium]|nr:HEAT repeat domain-containing protein [Planctomycetales bacterium]
MRRNKAYWLVGLTLTALGLLLPAQAGAVEGEPGDFQPPEIRVPAGFSVELAAGPPLVSHPTMACFDEQGGLYVCNNAGVNMSNEELEQHLPNAIHRLVDDNGDGQFDSFTVFADKLTFPMGGAWHEGALYVASPPNIWRLRDSDGDGVADERKILVSHFGYNGNAASIHGCFFGPDGRLYWTDGYHGHEIKDEQGKVTSKRAGSYLFSCRPDGGDVQIHCGGGMDNPVEVDFTDSGDMLGTVNILYTRPRQDCLVHWLHGGAYPHRRQVLSEIKATGDFLTPAHSFGHVAVSGMTRYRSAALDPSWGDNLFTTFFNSGKVVRLSLQRQGSSYGVSQNEFLSSPSREFHPTDVLEDADGSLLVIDTGGWFYRGCPTSQFAKPELLGGIYRIRREAMPSVTDPRGLQIAWAKQTEVELTQLLNDSRFAVRQRAISECAARGQDILETLAATLSNGSPRTRVHCVWVLSRLVQQAGLAESASELLRPALSDAAEDVRQAACAALARSVRGVDTAWLVPLLQDSAAGVRRQAATALGMLDRREALPHLLSALDRESLDRPEEHALIYAMIEMASPQAIRDALRALPSGQPSLPQWRGAVIALDQIDGGQLRLAEIELGLESADARSRKVAADIAQRHPEWLSPIANKLENWLESGQWSARRETIESLLAIYLNQAEVAALAGRFLQEQQPPEVRELILRVIAGGGSLTPHDSWLKPIRQQLSSADEEQVRQAMSAVLALQGNAFADALGKIAEDEEYSLPLRVEALAALTRQAGSVSDDTLEELLDIYQDSASPTAARRAAQILGQARLSPQQLKHIAPLLEQAAPVELRDLIAGYQRTTDRDVGQAFLVSLAKNPALLSLAEYEVSDVIKSYPPELLGPANRLLDRLKEHEQQKMSRLQDLRDKLHEGDAMRGKIVFNSEKAKCSSCHRVGDQGLRVGPDLTTIGGNRAASDLLESIVFPSASMVRDYDPYKILTADGRVLNGLIASETQQTLELQQANGEKMVLHREDIEQIVPSSVSIMPAGLDEALTEAELLDVVAYLQSLK